MTKKKTGEQEIMEAFKVTKQNIDVIYENHSWNTERDEPVTKVLTFLDIKGYSLNGPYLIVQEKDDTQYVFPMDKASSLKLYITE